MLVRKSLSIAAAICFTQSAFAQSAADISLSAPPVGAESAPVPHEPSRSFAVTPDADGNILCRVNLLNPDSKRSVAITGVVAHVVDSSGVVVTSAVSDILGTAHLGQLPEGVYTLVAKGPDTFAAIGFAVDRSNHGGQTGSISLSVDGIDVANAPEAYRLLSAASFKTVASTPVPVAPGPGTTTVTGSPIPLEADGSLKGRVAAMADVGSSRTPGETTLSFIRNGSVERTAVTTADGAFQLSDMSPGVYAVVVVADAGYAVHSVSIVEADQAASPFSISDLATYNETIPVMMLQAGGLQITLAPSSSLSQTLDQLNPDGPPEDPTEIPVVDPLAAPQMAGPGGSGGGSGGGAGGGGGGLGGILGALGAGLGAAALADDDDTNIVISPAGP